MFGIVLRPPVVLVSVSIVVVVVKPPLKVGGIHRNMDRRERFQYRCFDFLFICLRLSRGCRWWLGGALGCTARLTESCALPFLVLGGFPFSFLLLLLHFLVGFEADRADQSRIDWHSAPTGSLPVFVRRL